MLALGGAKFIWNQFPFGPLPHMPYSAFVSIFSDWNIYDQFSPPLDSILRIRRKQIRTPTWMPTSYETSVHCGQRFEETRFLTNGELLGNWLDFGELKPNNPALHKGGKCFSERAPEANLVSGLWVSFSRNPRLDRRDQVRITGWISVLFFNSSGLIRQGDETNGSEQVLATVDNQARLKIAYAPCAGS